METGGSVPKLNQAEVRPKPVTVPMHIAGGNSTLEEAQVVFLGTDNHYDTGYQSRISRTLQILPREGDVVLTEGEGFGKGLKSSWVPEMARVNTDKVTLTGWENTGLYNRATRIVSELQSNIYLYNAVGNMSLGQMAAPLLNRLKQRIDSARSSFDRVVLHERSSAMKRSVMSALGRSMQEDGRVFVYAGSAHLTGSELSGMGSVKHVVLGV